MTEPAKPLSFGHHSLAVLGAAMLGSILVSLPLATILATSDRFPGIWWMATTTVFLWLAIFFVALPGAGIALSLVWPVTRRRTSTANWICVLPCTTMAILLTPLASSPVQGVTSGGMSAFALIGAIVTLCYLAVARRLGRETPIPSKAAVPAS